MNSQTQWSSIQTPSEPITPERQSSPGLSNPFSQSLSINQMTTMTKKIEDLAEIARQIAHSKEILLQWITSIMKEALDLKEQANKIVKEIQPIIDDPHLTLENCWSLWNSVMTMINTLAQSLLSTNRWRTSLPPELRARLELSLPLLPTPPSATELITSASIPVEIYIPNSEEELQIVGNSYPTGELQQQ